MTGQKLFWEKKYEEVFLNRRTNDQIIIKVWEIFHK